MGEESNVGASQFGLAKPLHQLHFKSTGDWKNSHFPLQLQDIWRRISTLGHCLRSTLFSLTSLCHMWFLCWGSRNFLMFLSINIWILLPNFGCPILVLAIDFLDWLVTPMQSRNNVHCVPQLCLRPMSSSSALQLNLIGRILSWLSSGTDALTRASLRTRSSLLSSMVWIGMETWSRNLIWWLMVLLWILWEVSGLANGEIRGINILTLELNLTLRISWFVFCKKHN